MRVSIKERSDPRNHTKGTRNITNKNRVFSCGFVLLRVISWIVIIFQQPAGTQISSAFSAMSEFVRDFYKSNIRTRRSRAREIPRGLDRAGQCAGEIGS